MPELTPQELISRIPTRKLHDEFVPLVAFDEILRLLKMYRWTPKELEFFAAEIDNLKGKS